MLKERESTSGDFEIPGSRHISRIKMYETPAGPLLLRNYCSAALVEGLRIDEGLRAFARLAIADKESTNEWGQEGDDQRAIDMLANATIAVDTGKTDAGQYQQVNAATDEDA